MTIKEIEEKIIPKLEEIDGVARASVDDYNSEEASIIILPQEDANLKKVTPAIKRVFKDFGIEKAISDWMSPSPKDEWGERDYDYYMLDVIYPYYDLKIQSPEGTEEVMVFSKELEEDSPYASDVLEEKFYETYDNAEDERDHAEQLEEIFPNHFVYPLYVYKHGTATPPQFRQSRTGTYNDFDIGVNGMVSIEKGSDKDISDIITELNEKIKAMYISEEATIPSSLCEDDVDDEEPGGISPNRGV